MQHHSMPPESHFSHAYRNQQTVMPPVSDPPSEGGSKQIPSQGGSNPPGSYSQNTKDGQYYKHATEPSPTSGSIQPSDAKAESVPLSGEQGESDLVGDSKTFNLLFFYHMGSHSIFQRR